MAGLKEADHGRLLATWLKQRGILFLHVPNEGVRSVMTASDLIKQGLQPGAPDYLIFSVRPSPPPGNYPPPAGVAIELKRVGWKPKNKADKARLLMQQEFLDNLAREGWATKICYGWEDAVKFLQELGY